MHPGSSAVAVAPSLMPRIPMSFSLRILLFCDFPLKTIHGEN